MIDKATRQYLNIKVALPRTVQPECPDCLHSSRFEHDDTARFYTAGTAFDTGCFNSRNKVPRRLRRRIDQPPPVCFVEGGKLGIARVRGNRL
jgi:hypothetical protein